MTSPNVPSSRKLERILSESWGVPVTVARLEHLAPWAVLRCHLAEKADGSPASVIVKWLRDDPKGFRIDPRQVRTERAALEFLAGLEPELAPRLLASDLASTLLVLEDLAPRVPLADLLRRAGAVPSATGMFAFARAMGELGAATKGHQETYTGRRVRYGQPAPAASGTDVLGRRWVEVRPRMEELALPINGPADKELTGVVEMLTAAGDFDVFTNGDAESNNFLVGGADGRIIDFEFARYCHAAVNATWIHVPGPAWMTVTNRLVPDLETEFRRALSRTLPAADDDDLFGSGMAAACLAKALERLNRFPVLDAREPGDDSRVQMVATLESAADAADGHRAFPNIAGWVRDVAAFLRRRWKDADVDLSRYRDHTQRR